jgi:hypothetical protein
MTLDVWSLACGDRDVCEKRAELIRPNFVEISVPRARTMYIVGP